MTTQAVSVAQYESQVKRFKPELGLAAPNANDVRRFIHDWFAYFEHAPTVEFLLSHLDDKNMSIVFPGVAPLTSHADFRDYYQNLFAQTLWNFHDLSAIQLKQTAPRKYLVSFIMDWYAEIKPDSPQLARWQSRSDSHFCHHQVRQTWTVTTGDQLLIETLVASGGDTPSPISE